MKRLLLVIFAMAFCSLIISSQGSNGETEKLPWGEGTVSIDDINLANWTYFRGMEKADDTLRAFLRETAGFATTTIKVGLTAEYFPKEEWSEGSIVLFKLYNQLKGSGKYFQDFGQWLLINEKKFITFDMVVDEVSFRDLLDAMLEISEDVKNLDKDGTNPDLELHRIVRIAAGIDKAYKEKESELQIERKALLTMFSKR
jgi:hypothetical protein